MRTLSLVAQWGLVALVGAMFVGSAQEMMDGRYFSGVIYGAVAAWIAFAALPESEQRTKSMERDRTRVVSRRRRAPVSSRSSR